MNDKPDKKEKEKQPFPREFTPGAIFRTPAGKRLAIMKGQDRSRWTDVYHAVLRAPWWLFFLGLAAFFATINVVFQRDGYLLCHPGLLTPNRLPAPYKISSHDRLSPGSPFASCPRDALSPSRHA